MTMYNARIELNEKNPEPSRADDLVTKLADFHPSVGQSPRRWLTVHISLPAESLLQATTAAIALSEHATGVSAIVAEVMLESEFDAREGFDHVSDLIATMDAAALLGVSRARVHQMIDEGKFASAQRVGRGWAVARSEVDAKVAAKS